MTVRDLLSRLDSPELTEWMAFLEGEAAQPAAPVQPEMTEEQAWKRAFGINDG